MISRIVHAVRVRLARRREKKKEKTRSPQWKGVRDAHLHKHNACAACGSKLELQVHHKLPYHLHPELELDPDNLITLCMHTHDCHQFIGHGGRWKSWNPHVDVDAKDALMDSKRRRFLENKARTQRED